jgi:hypothetical protein
MGQVRVRSTTRLMSIPEEPATGYPATATNRAFFRLFEKRGNG